MIILKPRFHPGIQCTRFLRRDLTTSALSGPAPPQPSPPPPPPPPPPPTGHALLTTRRLIALSGSDASRFLHGLTTTNIPPSSSIRSGFYSAFLNAAGRVLHDVFIYPTAHSPAYRQWLNGSSSGEDDEAGFLIEVDAEQVQTLAAHLKKFKLRARVQIRVVEEGEWGVWSAWFQDEGMRTAPRAVLPTPPSFSPKGADADAEIGCVDQRAPGMGSRMVLPGEIGKDGDKVRHWLHTTGARVSVGSYEVRRILHGVAEGQAEIVREKALPLESNMDYMGGIDFRKGCYVGQELTIRTHHTGVVRKRILPVQLYVGGDGDIPPPTRLGYGLLAHSGGWREVHGPTLPLPPRGATIARADGKGRSAGKWLGGVENVGLALCRLDAMTDEITPRQSVCKFVWDSEEGKSVEEDGVERMKQGLRVLVFVPSWHHDEGRR